METKQKQVREISVLNFSVIRIPVNHLTLCIGNHMLLEELYCGVIGYISLECFGIIKIETIWSNISGSVQEIFLQADIAFVEFLAVC